MKYSQSRSRLEVLCRSIVSSILFIVSEIKQNLLLQAYPPNHPILIHLSSPEHPNLLPNSLPTNRTSRRPSWPRPILWVAWTMLLATPPAHN